MLKKTLSSLFIALIVFSCSKDSPTEETTTTPPAQATKFQVNVSPGTGGTVSTPGGSFDADSSVTITATPNTGYEFTGWTGGASGNTNPLTIKVTQSTNISATFALVKNDLKVIIIGNGTVSQQKTSSARATETTEQYTPGSTVRLTAAAANGWLFYTWSGASTSTKSEIDVLVDGSKTVTATFEEKIIDVINSANAATKGFLGLGKWIIRDAKCDIKNIVFRTDGTFTLTSMDSSLVNGVFNVQERAGTLFNVFLTVGSTSYASLEDATLTNNYISFTYKSSKCNDSSLIEGDRDKTYVESQDPNTKAPVAGVCKVSIASTEGPQTQTVTQTNAIQTVSYSFSADCTDTLTATVTGLPQGVTMTFTNNKAVINGTPTTAVSGTHNYAITVNSNTSSVTVAGVINIVPPCSIKGVLSLGKQNQNVFAGENLESVRVNFSASCNSPLTAVVTGLPNGSFTTFSNNRLIIIGGTTAGSSGTYNYLITVSNGSTSTTFSGSIKIIDCPTVVTLASGPVTQTVTRTNAIKPITYNVIPSCSRTATVVGSFSLPDGVTATLNNNQLVISGTPRQDMTQNTYSYEILINDDKDIGKTITITGTINLVGTCISQIKSTLPSGSINSVTVSQSSFISPIIYDFTSTCNNVITATATGLPPGFTLSYEPFLKSAVISGNSSATGVYNYQIKVSDKVTSTTINGSIKLVACPLSATLSSGPQTQTVTQTDAITPITYNFNSGCNKTLRIIESSGLPKGITIKVNNNQAVVSGAAVLGTPNGVYLYSVSAFDDAGSKTVSGSIKIVGTCSSPITSKLVSGPSSQVVTGTMNIVPVTYSFESICDDSSSLTYTVSGLPVGIRAEPTAIGRPLEITLEGFIFSASASNTHNYKIVVSNTSGTTSTTVSGSFQLVSGTSTSCVATATLASGSGAKTQTVAVNTAINNITFDINNCNAPAALVTAVGLPPGVKITVSPNNDMAVISGTPTSSGTYNYDLLVNLPQNKSFAISGSIIVN